MPSITPLTPLDLISGTSRRRHGYRVVVHDKCMVCEDEPNYGAGFVIEVNKQISGSQHSIFDLFDYRFRFNGFLYRFNTYFVGLAARSELLFDLFVDFSGVCSEI